MDVNLKLGKFMKDNKITIYKLVKDTNLGYRTVRNYKNGSITRIDLDILGKIITALNIEDINDILEIKK